LQQWRPTGSLPGWIVLLVAESTATRTYRMNSTLVFEVCVDTVEAALAAQQGGADRIELCSSLAEGGLTPGPGLLQRVMRQVTLPVHAMIRPRGGDFFCSDDDLAAMEQDILFARANGCAGVVFGILRANGCIDIARARHLATLAAPMEVTFHRAFDDARDLPEALEFAIAAGAGRVLTSGGCATASDGAEAIAALVRQAAGRVQVAVGGGITARNVGQIVRQTGATHVHASLRPSIGGRDDARISAVTADAVRDFVEAGRNVSPAAANGG
jgi:copper homeostasis protein